MICALLGFLLGAAPVDDTELQAGRHLARAYEHAGRSAPVADPALAAAARLLARSALAAPTFQAAEGAEITDALSAARSWDVNPRLLLILASPPEEALGNFLRRTDLAEEPATHLGVALATSGNRAVLAVLLSERKAVLEDVPLRLPGPGERRLCGTLRPSLADASVFVTVPTGAAERLTSVTHQGARFCTSLRFASPGRYTVEVLGSGPGGPEVAALFRVDVGKMSPEVARAHLAEPRDVPAARQAVLAEVNALRRANGSGPVESDVKLDAVAQAYAEQMAREHFFAHVAPGGQKLTDRLRAAGYAARLSGENLGLSSGPLSAHAGIEQSPGHRKNLLEPGFERLGLGIAVESVGGRRQTLLVEVLAAPIRTARDPLQEAYERLALQRAALRLPALRRNPALEALAAEQARKALASNDPRAELGGKAIHDRVFEALSNAASTTADVFVAQEVGEIPPSRGLSDRRNALVGVGAVRGDSPTYGKDRYWVVVIYAGLR